MKNQPNVPNSSGNLVYLRISKVAEILDISRTSVYDLVRAGEFRGVIKVGSRLRIPASAVEEFTRRVVA
jgi:excisionase family DNA binding protein